MIIEEITRAATRAQYSGVYLATGGGVAEELRVDVDGAYPTMTVSGSGRSTWLARVEWDRERRGWAGTIDYRDGAEPHTEVLVRLTGAGTAEVVRSGGDGPDSTRRYEFARAAFRTVGIEFDAVEGAVPVTDLDLGAHPNHPAGLPARRMTIEDAYGGQGIMMSRTRGGDVLPVSDAGRNASWSDIELHDAMTAHWSKWADTPQWQVWTLFAGRHDEGPDLGGIMFDQMGAAQRQGCAVFTDSFISEPPDGDPAPDAALRRMRFWTAVHEIGHCFNLAHSWEKSEGNGWVPLADEPEARSFMNYPYDVHGGEEAFFADFEYRFSEDELLFLRHAPEHLVRMGDAPWFDDHGFERAGRAAAGTLALTLRVNRARPSFAALEPVVAEVKLTNTGPVPQSIDRHMLAGSGLTIVIKGDGRAARVWAPFARHCHRPEALVLPPGESLYAPVFLWAGRNGFDLAEPGKYAVYAALSTPAGDVFSAPLRLEVEPPRTAEIDRLAPAVLTEEVGRVLAFGGSRGGSAELDRANAVLAEVVARVPATPIGRHAAAALGSMAATPGRVPAGDRFELAEPDPAAARALLATAYADLPKAADTLGHIRLTRQAVVNAEALAATGARDEGARLAGAVAGTLRSRGVRRTVVAAVEAVAESLS